VVGGKDARKLSLLKRTKTRYKALSGSARCSSWASRVVRLYDAAAALQLEGIVAKRADDPTRLGAQLDWMKTRTPTGRHAQDKRSEEWNG
jgi:hypothetical protein